MREMDRPIKVVNVTSCLTGGGSGSATRRINDCLNKNEIESSLFLARPEMKSLLCRGGVSARARTIESKVRYKLSAAIASCFSRRDGIARSLAVLPSFRVRELNQLDADIINIHWTQGGFLSIRDIGLIQKPIVWTLHDSWLFCGAEHHPDYIVSRRYKHGYNIKETEEQEQVLVDIDRWCWNRKRKYLQNIGHIVAPSEWMHAKATEANLLKGKAIYRIPHPIDKSSFFKEDKVESRKELNLPVGKQLILFGGANPWKDRNKGWDLFVDSLVSSSLDRARVAIVTFGAKSRSVYPIGGFEHISLPYIESESRLRALYSSADLLVVPSKVESFGLVAAEAQMCGLPAVGFQGSGLSDVIEDGKSGILLCRRTSSELASCISMLLESQEFLERLGAQSMISAQAKWSYEVIGAEYREVFSTMLGSSKSMLSQ